MNLLRIELRKVLPYRTFWFILGIYALLMVLILYASSHITVNGTDLGTTAFTLPELWQRLTYVASYFNLLLGVLIIILVSDEYSFRTIRQQVIDGLSRQDVVMAKFFVVLTLAITSTVFLLVIGLYFGLVHGTNHSLSAIFSQSDFLLYYLVQAVAYMSLALLVSFFLRKSGLSIIAFIAYAKIIEPIIHFNVPDTLDKYMPMKVFNSLTPMPGQEILDQLTMPTELLSPAWAVLPSLLYIGLLLLLSFYTLKLRDI
ncbi:ABC transporter permease [Pontibacter silvestris]|uniref:ABC transporter permease n=1 Tax=Pontibacter silvestris TaxID=2305183 RepID=A0ABW4WUH2_9BACT|nr:ABC transporter permease [Pontibacter silvestris]MCC9136172.1 ABC transporter permease [Pontibacter silvestris]